MRATTSYLWLSGIVAVAVIGAVLIFSPTVRHKAMDLISWKHDSVTAATATPVGSTSSNKGSGKASKSVKCSEKDMLEQTRKAREDDMYDQIDQFVKTHPRVAATSVALAKRTVHEKWRGDKRKVTEDVVEVWWTIPLEGSKDPIRLHSRRACVCKITSDVYIPSTPLPPVTHVIQQHVQIRDLGNGCGVIDIKNLPVPGMVLDGSAIKSAELQYGYDSVDGPLPVSPKCGTIQQGHGPVRRWYNDNCHLKCMPLADYVSDMLGGVEPETREIFSIEVVDGHIRITAPLAILRKVMYFCLSFRLEDGRLFSTRFFYVTPPGRRPGEPNAGNFVSWGSGTHVTLDPTGWPADPPRGAADDDRHLHTE